MLRKIAVSLLLLFVVSVGTAYAAFPEIPRISNEELKALLESGADVLVLDTQPKAVYDSGHIKGAVSFPWKEELRSEDMAALPKGKLIVTYCDCGPGESDSAFIADQLLKAGFNQVKVLGEPGIRGWREAKYPMEK